MSTTPTEALKDSFPPINYDDLKLPEFSAEEAAIRGLEFTFGDLSAFLDAKGEDANKAALFEKQGAIALGSIDQLVADFVLEKAKKVLPGPDSAVLIERMEGVLRVRDWGAVPAGSEKFVLTELVTKANRVKFMLVQEWLDKAKDNGFNAVAKLEHKKLLPARAASDLMLLKAELEMDTSGIDYNKARKDHPELKNECALLRRVGEKFEEFRFDEAYAKETDVMTACLRELIGELTTLRSSYEGSDKDSMVELIDKKIAYYAALSEAVATNEMKQWEKVDGLMAGQVRDNKDTTVVHTIEPGYLKDSTLRGPGIGIRSPNLQEAEILRKALKTKEIMIASFEQDPLFDDCPSVKKSLDLLKKSGARVDHFSGSGLENRINPAAQILPNDFPAREKGGVVAFFNPAKVRLRSLPVLKDLVWQFFGDKAYKDYFEEALNVKDVDTSDAGQMAAEEKVVEEMVGEENASHELAHALALVEGVKERFGIELLNTYAEEWKATVLGLRGRYDFPTKNMLAAERHKILRKSILRHIGLATRFARQRNASPNYFRKSMMLMKVAQDVGILSKEGKEWKIDLESQKVEDFFGAIAGQAHELTQIYGDESPDAPDKMQSFFEKNLQTSPFIEDLAAKFPFDKGGQPDPDALPSKIAETPRQLPREKDVSGVVKEVGAAASNVIDETVSDEDKIGAGLAELGFSKQESSPTDGQQEVYYVREATGIIPRLELFVRPTETPNMFTITIDVPDSKRSLKIFDAKADNGAVLSVKDFLAKLA